MSDYFKYICDGVQHSAVLYKSIVAILVLVEHVNIVSVSSWQVLALVLAWILASWVSGKVEVW